MLKVLKTQQNCSYSNKTKQNTGMHITLGSADYACKGGCGENIIGICLLQAHPIIHIKDVQSFYVSVISQ